MEELVPRRTECLDSSHITSLITPATTKLFGRVHALDVIEKANLAITLTNGEPAGQVVAHAALYDYPNISEIDPTTWEVWLTTNYDVTMPTVMNSLFLHLFVSSDTINRESAAEEIFRTSFTALVPLQYVWLVTSPGVKLDVALQRLFSPVNPAEGATPTHMVYVTCRHQHFPMLHIRNSKVEDHDDLTPVFNQCASKLEQQYGDRCPSATARSTVGGTQGHLDLERDPLIHVIEERNKENPKLQRSQPIITEYGELYFSLNKWARCLQMMVSAFSIPTDMENTSGLILVTL